MKNTQIIDIIRESASLLDQDFDGLALASVDSAPRSYRKDEVREFIRDLTEEANKQRIIYLENTSSREQLASFVKSIEMPLLAFEDDGENYLPIIFKKNRRKIDVIYFQNGQSLKREFEEEILDKLYTEEGEIFFLGVFAYKSLVSDDSTGEGETRKKLSPVKRLFRLLSEERKDIYYIYFYAFLVGLLNLTLPIGIQATVSLISGGVVFSSVYLLIGLVIVGVLAAGGIQVLQITLVEYLQRRVFTKAAFEFAFRVPRIKASALANAYAPELMNRFFDVLTIQKGLPKLLIDLSAGIIQILFGLMLLSFYHPFFVFFSLVLIGALVLIFYATGPKGLNSSIKESKLKYKVVYWLEELARTINSFKLSGNTPLPIRKTDYNVNNYLKNRRIHFSVLISQYSFVLLFKAMVTGGLLIIGTILVIQREITLGQFVAAEVIIILTLSSVEKIIMYMDVVYDMLTAVDKIAHVTDLPLEKSGGLDIPDDNREKGFAIRVKNLSYKFPGKSKSAINQISLNIDRGEKVCITGKGGSGKTVFTNTIAGLHEGYEGIITVEGFSLRDLDLTNLRDRIGKNVFQEDIFEGTILENILLAKPHATPSDALWALRTVGIEDEVHSMKDGLDTQMVSGGKGLSRSLVNKIILARCLAKKPSLLVLTDFFNDFLKSEKIRLMNTLTAEEQPWTLIAVSNDPLIMSSCDRVILLENGSIKTDGTFNDLLENKYLDDIIN